MADDDSQYDSELSDYPDSNETAEASDSDDPPPAAVEEGAADQIQLQHQHARDETSPSQVLADPSNTQPSSGLPAPSQTLPPPVAITAPAAPIQPASILFPAPNGFTTIREGMIPYHGTRRIDLNTATDRDFVKNNRLRHGSQNHRSVHLRPLRGTDPRGANGQVLFDRSGRLAATCSLLPFYMDRRFFTEEEWHAITREWRKAIGDFRRRASLSNVKGDIVLTVSPAPTGYDYSADLVPMLFPGETSVAMPTVPPPHQPTTIAPPVIAAEPLMTPASRQPVPRAPSPLKQTSSPQCKQDVGRNRQTLNELAKARQDKDASAQAKSPVDTARTNTLADHSDTRALAELTELDGWQPRQQEAVPTLHPSVSVSHLGGVDVGLVFPRRDPTARMPPPPPAKPNSRAWSDPARYSAFHSNERYRGPGAEAYNDVVKGTDDEESSDGHDGDSPGHDGGGS